MQYSPIKRCLRLVVFAFLLNLSGCYSGEAEKYTVAVDMSAEYKEGRFQPQNGDYVILAGNFNDWNKDELILEPEPGSQIYTAAIDRLLLTNDFTSDTLRFKFIHHSGDGRQIANQGWKVIKHIYETSLALPLTISKIDYPVIDTGKIYFELFRGEGYDSVLITSIVDSLFIYTPIDTIIVLFRSSSGEDTILINPSF